MTLALDLRYVAPTSLDGALAALAAETGRAVPLAGGTDLVPWMRDGSAHPEVVVDLKRVPGLGRLALRDEVLHLGCLVTFSDLLSAPVVRERLPVVTEMAGAVASVGIRSRATLAGNLCSAVPSGDAGPVLLVLGADVHVLGPRGARAVPIDRWFVGPRRTDLAPDELVTGVSVPVPPPDHGAAFARLSRYRGEDLAQASVAVLVVPGDRVRVAFAAVAPIPARARRIEQLLEDVGLHRHLAVDPEQLDDAVALVPEEIAPITDLRASDHYRLRMCEVMLRRAVVAATARAAGGGPPHGTSLL
jgi:aerobic carbon-monoxide dehydrogenase medium subunit